MSSMTTQCTHMQPLAAIVPEMFRMPLSRVRSHTGQGGYNGCGGPNIAIRARGRPRCEEQHEGLRQSLIHLDAAYIIHSLAQSWR